MEIPRYGYNHITMISRHQIRVKLYDKTTETALRRQKERYEGRKNEQAKMNVRVNLDAASSLIFSKKIGVYRCKCFLRLCIVCRLKV